MTMKKIRTLTFWGLTAAFGLLAAIMLPRVIGNAEASRQAIIDRDRQRAIEYVDVMLQDEEAPAPLSRSLADNLEPGAKVVWRVMDSDNRRYAWFACMLDHEGHVSWELMRTSPMRNVRDVYLTDKSVDIPHFDRLCGQVFSG